MRRLPLLSLPAVALATGILRSGGAGDSAWISVVLLVAWAASRRNLSARAPLLRAGTVAAAFFCAGSWIAGAQLDSARRVAELLPEDGTRIPTVCLLPEADPGFGPVGARCLLQGRWLPMRVRVYSDLTSDDRGGWATGSLQRPRGARNPGEPDPLTRSLRTGIGAWFLISARDSSASGTPRRSTVGDALRARIDALYGRDSAGSLVRAMLSGRREDLPESVTDDFRRIGVSHVLAVSGLHVSLVLLLVAVPASFGAAALPLGYTARRLVEAVLSLVLLWLVVQVTGPRPSVLRAALLGVLVSWGRLLDRSGSASRAALPLSIVVQSVMNPGVLQDAGFLLSHAAVAGLLMAGSNRGWASGFFASLGATWATAPLVALFFDRIPLAGLVTNAFALPLTSVIVISGTLSLPSSPWSLEFAASAHMASESLLWLAGRSADLLGFLAVDVDPALATLLVLLPLAAGFRGRSLFVATLILAASSVAALSVPMRVPFRYLALEAGQGDAQVLVSTRGTPYIIDTGPPSSRALERWLERNGHASIGAAFLTHLHADHTGRWKPLSERFAVDSLFLPEGSLPPESLLTGAGLRFLSAGDVVHLDDGTAVRVLAPERNAAGEDANSTSLVLHVRHGNTTLILTGDAEIPSEASMTARWDSLLRADVIKVAHHGSRTSSAPWFVSRVDPRFAVVSVGRNGYGLPNDEIIDRWRESGATVHVTRSDGAFCLVSHGARFRTGC